MALSAVDENIPEILKCYEVFKTLAIIFGLGVWSHNPQNIKKPNFQIWHFIWGVFLIFIGILTAVVGHIFNVCVTLNFFVLTVFILTFSSIWLSSNSLQILFDDLYKFDKRLTEINANKLFGIQKSKKYVFCYTMFFETWLYMILCEFVYTFLSYNNMCPTKVIGIIVSLLINGARLTVFCIFITLCKILSSRFLLLFAHWNLNLSGNFKFQRALLEMEKIRLLHSELTCLVYDFSHSFGQVMLVIFISFLFAIIRLFYELVYGNEEIHEIVLFLLGLDGFIIYLIILSACELESNVIIIIFFFWNVKLTYLFICLFISECYFYRARKYVVSCQ